MRFLTKALVKKEQHLRVPAKDAPDSQLWELDASLGNLSAGIARTPRQLSNALKARQTSMHDNVWLDLDLCHGLEDPLDRRFAKWHPDPSAGAAV